MLDPSCDAGGLVLISSAFHVFFGASSDDTAAIADVKKKTKKKIMDEHYLVSFFQYSFVYYLFLVLSKYKCFYLFQLLALHSFRKPFQRIKMRDKHLNSMHGKRERRNDRNRKRNNP